MRCGRWSPNSGRRAPASATRPRSWRTGCSGTRRGGPLRPPGRVRDVAARVSARLARLLSLVLFGDFVSVYVALLRGVDPTPVPPIDEVKRRLRLPAAGGEAPAGRK